MAMHGDETIDERLKLFINQKEIVKQKIAELQETLEVVEFKCWYYETAKKEGTVNIPKNMPVDELPEEYRNIRLKLKQISNENIKKMASLIWYCNLGL